MARDHGAKPQRLDAAALLTTPVFGALWPLAGCPAFAALRSSTHSWRYHSRGTAPLAEKGAAALVTASTLKRPERAAL